MDNITRSLISGLMGHLGIPEGTSYHEECFHQIIKNHGLDLSSPRINGEVINFLMEGEFEYAYIQVILNSVIPKGTAEEFLRGSVKFETYEDHYGDTSYNLRLYGKTSILKMKDPVWVWENRKDIEEFMEDSWEPYLKIKQIIDYINSL